MLTQVDREAAAREAADAGVVSFAEELFWRAECDPPLAVPFLECASTLSRVFRLRGRLNRAALQAGLDDLVRRHEVLRSAFVEQRGSLRRVCRPPAPVPVTDLDLGQESAGDADALRRALASGAAQTFDLEAGPLVRAIVAAVAVDDWRCVVTVHHIVCDQWARQLIAAELQQAYETYAAGGRPAQPAPALTYRDYVEWQRRELAGDRYRALMNYWTERLRFAPDLIVPPDNDGEAAPSARPGTCRFALPADQARRLGRLGRTCKATVATTLLAMFQLLLHALSGAEDIVVGVPISDRRRLEFEALVGLFSNVIVVRTTVARNLTIRDLLERARAAFTDACLHQDLPYGHLVQTIGATTPLYRALFSFVVDVEPELPATALTIEPLKIDPEPQSYADLSLHVVGGPAGTLACRLLYKADLFSRSRIEGFVRMFQSLVGAALDAPDAPIAGVLTRT